MKTMHRTAILAAGLAGLALLSACSGSSDAPPAETDVANIVEVENVTVVENVATPEPVPTANATTAARVPPSADFTDPEQVQADAEAAGMTARVSRGDDTANETAPAQ